MKSKFVNSKVFKIFDYCFRLVLINLLILIPSFLILWFFDTILTNVIPENLQILLLIPTLFYFFPAIVAGVDLVRMYELKITKGLFKYFFKSFGKHYVKSLIDSVIIALVIILFYNSGYYFYQELDSGVIYILGFILTISFALMILCILFHLPLVMTYMDGCKFYEDIKLAVMMSFKDLFVTLGIVIVSAIVIYLGIIYNPVMIICGISLPIYLDVKLTFKKYFLVYVRTHKEGEEIDELANK